MHILTTLIYQHVKRDHQKKFIHEKMKGNKERKRGEREKFFKITFIHAFSILIDKTGRRNIILFVNMYYKKRRERKLTFNGYYK